MYTCICSGKRHLPLALTQCINMHFALLFNIEVPIRFQFVTRNTKTITASTYRKYKPNGVIYHNLMHSSTQNERNICAFNLIGSTSSQRFALHALNNFQILFRHIHFVDLSNVAHNGLNGENAYCVSTPTSPRFNYFIEKCLLWRFCLEMPNLIHMLMIYVLLFGTWNEWRTHSGFDYKVWPHLKFDSLKHFRGYLFHKQIDKRTFSIPQNIDVSFFALLVPSAWLSTTINHWTLNINHWTLDKYYFKLPRIRIVKCWNKNFKL